MSKKMSVLIVALAVLCVAVPANAVVSYVGQDSTTHGAWRSTPGLNGETHRYGNEGYIDIGLDLPDWQGVTWEASKIAGDVVSLPSYIEDYDPTYDPSHYGNDGLLEGRVESWNGGADKAIYGAEDPRMPGGLPNDFGAAQNFNVGWNPVTYVSYDLLPSASAVGASFDLSMYLADDGNSGSFQSSVEVTIDDGSGPFIQNGVLCGSSGQGWDNWVTFRISNWDGVTPISVKLTPEGGWLQGGSPAAWTSRVDLDIIAFDVPEPATMVLLALGGLMIRRKK